MRFAVLNLPALSQPPVAVDPLLQVVLLTGIFETWPVGWGERSVLVFITPAILPPTHMFVQAE